ncbi:MAG: serine hydrolase domain-containing protein, partial [Sphingopyxis sp.]
MIETPLSRPAARAGTPIPAATRHRAVALALCTVAALALPAITTAQPQPAGAALPAPAVQPAAPTAPPGHILPPAALDAARAMLAKGTDGVTIIHGGPDGQFTRADMGGITTDTAYPIASASKWLVAAMVMSLVDDGRLTLDQPVSTWLPNSPPAARTITLRHLLAQTSGVAGSLNELYDLRQDHRITLRQSADQILARPPVAPPGAQFTYGGPGFQIVGAVVEAVTGQRWAAAFQQRIAQPLGMQSMQWTHLQFGAPTPPAAQTRNPVLQGGAVSTAEDYRRFLAMLAGGGVYDGRRILSAAAVTTMLN